MSPAAALDPASAECGIAGLYLRLTPERTARLRVAARPEVDWAGLLANVESHGVLGLFRRNLGRAGVALPSAARGLLDARARILEQDAERFRFTLRRFLAEAEARGLRPILLKGASLGLDLYPDPWLRAQGDVDLLVEAHELELALRAGLAAGLVEGPEALPGWWYRTSHFHRKLVPSNALLREVEIHWELHHPALLLTVGRRELTARARDVQALGFPARTLDPLDRFLHLVTHLASHAGGDLGPPDHATLLAVLADVSAPVRFKWIVDLHGEWERRADEWTAAAILERTCEWNAEAHLADALALLAGGLSFEGAGGERCSEVRAALPTPPAAGQRARRRRREPLEGLDFRPGALGALVPWIFPPRDYVARRYGARGPLATAAARASHAARVLLRLVVALLALPAALVGRLALRGERRRVLEGATSPERALDAAVAWRGFLAEEAAARAVDVDERETRLHS